MLHSGNLYGTERMALATAQGLRDEFDPIILAPPGSALIEASRLGLETKAFASLRDLVYQVSPVFSGSRDIAVVATGVMQSICAIAQCAIHRRQMAHLHVVHGGTEERLSYGRKRLLNRTGTVLVAVSSFVKVRLIANGVRADKVEVIENFLSKQRIAEFYQHETFQRPGIRKALIISRVDPIKRVDLLLSALDQQPALAEMEFRVLGTGWDLEKLRTRAALSHPNVTFTGFVNDVRPELAQTDVLIHLCATEPFGLAILEAMAARVPVLVPDRGGAGSLIDDGVSGFRFQAEDPKSLGEKLLMMNAACPCKLNRIVENGVDLLNTRFSPTSRINDYRMLLYKGLS
jgi:glycosyltransferase involved in cell wall biosynthesis